MREQTTNRAVVRAKTALQRQRHMVLYLLIAVVVLGVTLGLTLFFTSRTAFYDPTDGAKYYVSKKEGVYALRTTSGEMLPQTEGGNYVTASGTIVYVDAETGDHSTVAAVLVEDGETVKFDTSTTSYDVLLYPLIERAKMHSIEIHNENGSFRFVKVTATDAETGGDASKFVIEGREDLLVDQSTLFATLVYCTGRTQTLLRLDTTRVKELGYAEYGLPENPDDATSYFIITTIDGASHKVIFGDEIPSGDGYFVRYAGRDAVYVISDLTASQYNGTYADALFGKVEDYVTSPPASLKMEANNYFDVTNFRLYKNGVAEPVVGFSYNGSITRRQNTFYSSMPYTTEGGLSGYSVNSYSVDTCLYSLFHWTPEFVVKLGSSSELSGTDLNDWLKPYGLDLDSYQYQLSFTFNAKRTYNEETGKDVIAKADQEQHTILISHRQEDGYFYVYNICYLYDPNTRDFTKLAEGYNMIVALDEAQLEFLFYTTKDWISGELFSGHVAFMEEMSIQIAPGMAEQYPNGYRETFYLDNTESFNRLAQQQSAAQISADYVHIMDSAGRTINDKQFKTFYSALLYTACSGESSLSDTERQAHIDSGTEGAALVIKIKYVLRELNKDTGYYEATGEVVEREYCFYQNYAYPRQYYTTVNGKGDFYTISTRVKKIISDVMKLYGTPETDPIDYGSLN